MVPLVDVHNHGHVVCPFPHLWQQQWQSITYTYMCSTNGCVHSDMQSSKRIASLGVMKLQETKLLWVQGIVLGDYFPLRYALSEKKFFSTFTGSQGLKFKRQWGKSNLHPNTHQNAGVVLFRCTVREPFIWNADALETETDAGPLAQTGILCIRMCTPCTLPQNFLWCQG